MFYPMLEAAMDVYAPRPDYEALSRYLQDEFGRGPLQRVEDYLKANWNPDDEDDNKVSWPNATGNELADQVLTALYNRLQGA